MVKNTAIIGAGINGLLTAFLATKKYPDLYVDIYDADKHPVNNPDHKGVTYGSKDARHITGSESIGFESSIHKHALRNTTKHEMAGWLLKDEAKLTAKEKEWRDQFEASYGGSGSINDLDHAHAALNYKGLAEWKELAKKYPFIRMHMIKTDGVEVYFQDQAAFEDDLKMETGFCNQYFKSGKVEVAENENFPALYSKKLIVPGISLRVKSLAIDLIRRLEANEKVTFHWERAVKSTAELGNGAVVWTSGITHVQPGEYKDHNVQGIVGCWVTTTNRGYQQPFKIAAPSPSAYINFTPDGDNLHVSGGFGWSGEYTSSSVIMTIAQPVAEHFVGQINKYLGKNLTVGDVEYCVRPSTPTGQPLLLTEHSGGKLNVYITGSAKSGTTHAPVLSEYVLKSLSSL